METSEIYSLKEKLEKLETEYYHLHEWFGSYDRLIWTLRSLVFTIYTVVVVYALDSPEDSFLKFVIALFSFVLFFCGMEICWLCCYWKRRALLSADTQRDGFVDKVNDGEKIRMRFARLIIWGFLRHRQEGLNNKGGGDSDILSPRWHYSMPPAPGYPLAGCSPAEPASVSPGNCYLTGFIQTDSYRPGCRLFRGLDRAGENN